MTEPKTATAGISKGITFHCPVCTAAARSRTSNKETHLLRTFWFQCTDLECGHTWEAHLSFVKTLSPSAFGPVSHMAPLRRPPSPPLAGTELNITHPRIGADPPPLPG
ncbi:ogr/Delta-like zinc finger family protein [Asticcacaulis biprosthecium C19]|uniref:Ogr/Delta-like zinc finger family protein n=1 Tax=Asticcacaulis biprosthecium C19 TaxID=715226 RepID=F4QJ16_9CAUL|nr:ogr/Delta-like zinc finger family protein [Asticcacaulis biprosthecium]EGF93079.1 ogr/Delta-like zinc finger family protein [Asticcacaulis biprosthecium C19]